jgi:hypothetical protein
MFFTLLQMGLRESSITIIFTEISLRKATGIAIKLSELSKRKNEEDLRVRGKTALL